MFWAAARAKTESAFRNVLEKIGEKKEECAEYLRAIPPDRWAAWAFPYPRYGHDTSNIIESVNAQWLPARDLPAFRLLVDIWTTMMTKIWTRKSRQHHNPRISDWAKTYLEKEFQSGRRHMVVGSDTHIAMVVAPQSRETHTVNLKLRQCTCLSFQDFEIPCRHAIAMACEYRLEPEDYVSDVYRLHTYRSTYQQTVTPIQARTDELSSDSDCGAPFLKRSRGRPRKRRCRRGERARGGNGAEGEGGAAGQQQVQHSCSYCGSMDHNRRTCRDGGRRAGEQHVN